MIEQKEAVLTPKVVSTPTPQKPKIKSQVQIEEPILKRDILAVMNGNPNYVYAWENSVKMPTGRKGNWVAVDKFHPDHLGLKVNIDHTPDEKMITLNELVLVCMRVETYNKLLKLQKERASNSKAKAVNDFREGIVGIKKDLGARHGAINLLEE